MKEETSFSSEDLKRFQNELDTFEQAFWDTSILELGEELLKTCSNVSDNSFSLNVILKVSFRFNDLLDERITIFQNKFQWFNRDRIGTDFQNASKKVEWNSILSDFFTSLNVNNTKQGDISKLEPIPSLSVLNSSITSSSQANSDSVTRFNRSPVVKSRVAGKSQVSFERTGLIPRSISRTVNRFLKELGPNAERILLQEFRISRYQLWVSVRCFFSIVFIPFFISNFLTLIIVKPAVVYFWNFTKTDLFLNSIQEEHAFKELHSYEEEFYFQSLLNSENKTFPIETLSKEPLDLSEGPESKLKLSAGTSTDTYQYQVEEKMQEIAEEINLESINSILHFFSDFLTFLTFLFLLKFLQAEILISRTFLTEILYSLSDTTKSFLIILGTDLLVGFHSPKAWEIVIETVLERFGLPNNEDFILLCVATVPVLLDTAFKYWIFRYLNKLSPSTVVTYHNMIE
nr:Envelope membrane protein [Pedinophyceae sp. YPF-701]